MKMEELQTGFWGYRKDSVYKLVAGMEEHFSSMLMEKDAQHAAALQEAQARIAELEAELRTAQEEQKAHRKNQDLISNAFLEAQAHVQTLRAESEAQERSLRSQLQEEAQRQKDQLEQYKQEVGRLRGTILELLRDLDDRTQKVEEEANAVSERLPEPNLNLTLFAKKERTGE